MDVSFIIPAHNEAANIVDCIQAIHAAARPLGKSYEVIVANDASTDGTAELAAENGATVVTHQRRQIAATRNLGSSHASGNLLIFVDGDTQVTPACISQAIAAIESGAVAGGAPFHFDGPMPSYARLAIPPLLMLSRWLNLTGGAFFFCTRKALATVGGWDESFFAGEEIDLARRLKRQGRFVLVDAHVTTSGRKFRTHRNHEILALFLRGVLRPATLKNRNALDFFYGQRRADPHKSP